MRNLDILNQVTVPQFIALSQMVGVIPINKWGQTLSLSETKMNNYHDVWDVDTPKLIHLTEPKTLYFASDSNDDIGKNLIFAGVIINEENMWELVPEVITLNGQTPVSTTGQYLRAVKGFNNNGVEFVGDIYGLSANNFSAGIPDDLSETQIHISPTTQQTLMSQFTIPDNYYGLILDRGVDVMGATATQTKNAEVHLQIRSENGVFLTKDPMQIASTFRNHDYYAIPKLVQPRSDIRFRIFRGEGNGTIVKATYTILMVHKDKIGPVLQVFD